MKPHPLYSIWQGVGPTVWRLFTFAAQVLLMAFLFWLFATLAFCL